MEDKSSSTDCDYLTCGRCLREFPLQNITNFIHHKKNDCDAETDEQSKNSDSLGRQLYCSSCTKAFLSAWDMLQHAQFTHNFKIFFDVHQRTLHDINGVTLSVNDGNSLGKENTETSETVDPKLFPLKQEITEEEIPTSLSISLYSNNNKKQDNCTVSSPEMQCCSSVLPKKRKQHMESSHQPTEGSHKDRGILRNDNSLRIGRKRMFSSGQYYLSRSQHGFGKYSHVRGLGGQNRIQTASKNRKYPSEIYIDGEHENQAPDPHNTNREHKNLPYRQDSYLEKSRVKNSHSKGLNSENLIGNSGSFIIQPGTVFSIPFSYPVLTESSSSSNASCSTIYTGCSTNNYNCQNQGKSSINISSNNSPVSQISACNIPELKSVSLTNSKPLVSSQLTADLSISDNKVQHSEVLIGQSPLSLNRPSVGHMRSPKMSNGSLQRAKENQLTPEQRARKRKYPTSRPFKCDQCDHAFNQRIHLKKHLSKHTGVKPFKCGQCDYSTVERSHLKVHIRIHTGEKPFKCTFCEYATAQNSTLKIHLKRHHGGLMFSCQRCGKRFAGKDSLTNHQKEHNSQHLSNQSLSLEKPDPGEGLEPEPGIDT